VGNVRYAAAVTGPAAEVEVEAGDAWCWLAGGQMTKGYDVRIAGK